MHPFIGIGDAAIAIWVKLYVDKDHYGVAFLDKAMGSNPMGGSRRHCIVVAQIMKKRQKLIFSPLFLTNFYQISSSVSHLSNKIAASGQGSIPP